MQRKLATWAESEPNRRCDRLLRLIVNREWLVEASRMVLASSGARTPGIDGRDKQRLQVKLDQHLDDLRASLLEESYRPQPITHIYIPKPNGKLRPLGIPALTDRIVQRADTNDGGGIIEAVIHLAKRPKLFRLTVPLLYASKNKTNNIWRQ
ncbi:hypothetical protein [[Ochrobactrum] quorumnocens]|uniref:hypothetical protein n=1 Tax=Ochrobactrum quorumnocens TaxID=271865 RepID=UPI001F30DEDC